jgi:hypothetical protein
MVIALDIGLGFAVQGQRLWRIQWRERLRPYLDHGILELDNNAAERGMRAIALGRKNYLFVGSEAGGKAAAIAYTLIETAKINAVDPHAWLADTLARIPDYKITKVDDLLPWRWKS